MARGTHTTLPSEEGDAEEDVNPLREKAALAFERDGFNLHAGVRIEAGDDVGRERLCRYGARPALSLERLRRLPAGRFAYRVKYARRGRAKHRVMTSTELLARLAALIPPPRYPLVRYSGVLAPRSAWRKDVVPKPPEADAVKACEPRAAHAAAAAAGARAARGDARTTGDDVHLSVRRAPARNAGEGPSVVLLAPNMLSVRHWDRILGGVLYAATPRLDWATLLRRTFSIDVLECPACHGRMRMLGSITERDAVRAILERLAMAADAPCVARARDPTDDEASDETEDE